VDDNHLTWYLSTGSGKSTLVSTIARLVDIQKGTICIGGVNIAEIAPRKLRSAVMTLPQETLIFQGTLRENVDPHGKHTDQHILKALRSCQMGGILERKYGETALDQKFSSDGADLSAGQRQLVCAARVLLEKPAVLLVDEGMFLSETYLVCCFLNFRPLILISLSD
jgi:ATP-binding cassette subfamily C (CFTR/MRP) protein 10